MVLKAKPESIEVNVIFWFIVDILRYFNNKEKKEYKHINWNIWFFKRYVAKVWKGVNFS